MSRHGRYGAVNRMDPRAAGVCDRGGEVRPLHMLLTEMRWAGNRLVPTGFRCCAQHIDPPHPQDRTLILRHDPMPVRDARPMPADIFLVPPAGLLGISFILGVSLLSGSTGGGSTPPPVVVPPVDPLAPGLLDLTFILDESLLA